MSLWLFAPVDSAFSLGLHQLREKRKSRSGEETTSSEITQPGTLLGCKETAHVFPKIQAGTPPSSMRAQNGALPLSSSSSSTPHSQAQYSATHL